jgi:peptidoglycan hydrolase-like protein with peptidoglycan-binding domain
MVANLWLASFLSIILSGCTLLGEFPATSNNGVSPQAVETQVPLTPPAAKQTQAETCDCPSSTEPAGNELSEVSAPVKKNPGKDQIQRAQALLKVSGANPGPIDGILGPKTRAALQTFYSRCKTVSDLVGSPDREIFQQDAVEIQATAPLPSKEQTEAVVSDSPPLLESVKDQSRKANTLVGQNISREQIRLVQIRLKASGFDPGPIDGILGPKTRMALQQELRASIEY